MMRLRIGALAAAAVIALTACGQTATNSGAPSAAPPASQPAGSAAAPSVAPSEAAPSSAVKEGGTLIVGLPGDMVLADPSLVSDSNSSAIQLNVVEGLLGVKAGTLGDIEPV